MENPRSRYYSGGKVIVSHLAYADDCIIFTRVNEQSVIKLMDLLHLYEALSGQLVNKAKSFMVFGRHVSRQRRVLIKLITSFSISHSSLSFIWELHYTEVGRKAIFFRILLRGLEARFLAGVTDFFHMVED